MSFVNKKHTDKPCSECKYWRFQVPQCQHVKNRENVDFVKGVGYTPVYFNSQFLRESERYCGPEGKWFERKVTEIKDANEVNTTGDK